ncbi:Uma2 family endonuclease [Leptolyngbya sp. 7M]|uniref:Uma2 family endonuclease n=1 Tax=Leptolyngbya sp. 7M TaxID=2812896 RepID=UPI001B8B4170|nr:Uma2 family endonuclease [Leptolyngbya sp. 7M]QYO61979.1 Uma2 family endonuclease [Leptolyngbya sp. 7M]
MTDSQILPATDTWVKATWEDYLQQIEQPGYEKAKGYYLDGWMRIEMLPVGSDHAGDHTLVIFTVGLFTTLKGIAARGLDNCTYRKTGKQECQPDVSYYLGKNARVIPSSTTVIDLDQYPPPDLVIEVAKSSIVDDRTAKRELYESLGVAEYWVLDVERVQILAYEMIRRGVTSGNRRQVDAHWNRGMSYLTSFTSTSASRFHAH